ncbi:MAG: tetratricopeptide repeat protein [Gallionella sp.]|nr:MAG: tetratricopeptide repeat protein [Gallionella sp.]
MKKTYRYQAHLIASMGLLCSGIAVAAEFDPGKADVLLKAGKAKEGYALLAPHEDEMAGNVDYDYLLGIAALDSGSPDKATLALERVLAVNPDYAGARLDLARAYFALGDMERAKTEFEAVQAQNPPPAAKSVIEQYLAAIDKKLNPGITVTGYLEGVAGYDTNVNTATAASQVFIPVFGASLTLDSASVAARDNYLALGGGLEIVKPLKPGLSLFAGADAKKRQNFFKDTFNTDNLDGRFGLNIDEGANAFRLAAQKGVYDIDDRLNHRLAAISGEWRHTFNPRNIVSVFGQYGLLRYGHDKTGTDLSYNDVDQSVAGLGWLHAFDDYGKNIVFASIYGGNENTVAATVRIDGDQKFWGIKLGGQKSLGENLEATGSAGFKRGDYRSSNPLILDYRRDHQHDLSLGLNWRPLQNWVVRPQLSYTRNDSNSGLNDYNRIDASITVRREFK